MAANNQQKNILQNNHFTQGSDGVFRRGNETVKFNNSWTTFNNATTNHKITNSLLDKKTKG